MKTLIKTVLLGLALPFSVLSSYGQTPQKNDLKKEHLIKGEPSLYLNQGGQIEVVPEFTSKEEKEAWFTNNPSFNPNEILPNGDVLTKVDIFNANNNIDVRERVIFTDDPSFPVYTQTGNQQVDDQNYNQKKQDWINQYPKKYNSMIQSESTTLSKKERLELDLIPKK